MHILHPVIHFASVDQLAVDADAALQRWSALTSRRIRSAEQMRGRAGGRSECSCRAAHQQHRSSSRLQGHFLQGRAKHADPRPSSSFRAPKLIAGDLDLACRVLVSHGHVRPHMGSHDTRVASVVSRGAHPEAELSVDSPRRRVPPRRRARRGPRGIETGEDVGHGESYVIHKRTVVSVQFSV